MVSRSLCEIIVVSSFLVAVILVCACNAQSSGLDGFGLDYQVDADEPDAFADGQDTGQPELCNRDTDDDGLKNCKEAKLCGGKGTNPNKKDTDGDGIDDLAELQIGTDPCRADTDGDGADDEVERNLGFDPTDPDTDNDGSEDGDHWIFSVCNEEAPAPVSIHTNQRGDWTIALHESAKVSDLELRGINSSPEAMGIVYPGSEIAGAVLTRTDPVSREAFTDEFQQQVMSSLRQRADQRISRGSTRTDNSSLNWYERLRFSTSESHTVESFRREVVADLLGVLEENVSGYASSGNATHTTFRVDIRSVIWSNTTSEETAPVVTVAVIPKGEAATGTPRKLANNLTALGSIAPAGTELVETCDRITQEYTPRKVDLLLVVDSDGDSAYKNAVRKGVDRLLAQVESRKLDYRVAVTNMQPANAGTPYNGSWYDDASKIPQWVEQAALSCESSNNWTCDEDEPHGLAVASDVLADLTSEPSRQRAKFIPFLFSDEGPGSVPDESSIGTYISEFRNKSTPVHAMTRAGDCKARKPAGAYQDVAESTGGFAFSLCGEGQLALNIRPIGPPQLFPEPFPAPASLRVFLDGQRRVSWSATDGFFYESTKNRLWLYGSAQFSDWLRAGERGFIAKTYRHFESWED